MVALRCSGIMLFSSEKSPNPNSAELTPMFLKNSLFREREKKKKEKIQFSDVNCKTEVGRVTYSEYVHSGIW
jgi:hypothetical protein